MLQLGNALKSIQMREFITPIVEIYTQIALMDWAHWNCTNELIECCAATNSNVFTLTAAIQILGKEKCKLNQYFLLNHHFPFTL